MNSRNLAEIEKAEHKMSYRSITTVLSDFAADAAALGAARDLANALTAHLDVHCLGIDPTRYEALPAGSAIVLDEGRASAAEQAQELADKAQAMFSPQDARVSIEKTVLAQLALDRHVARAGRYADLAVVGRPYADDTPPVNAIIFEALLFGARAPVIMCPTQNMPSFRSVAVAWNETDESLSAIRKAMPLLMTADHVDVVMIDPPSRSPERSDPGGAVALMLSRHGVKCEVSVLSKTLPRVSDVLLRFTKDRQSDLLVMGAYGHSRFREALIGGATRDILEEAELPVFMAH